MKNKKFGFGFWKGMAEVTSYGFIAYQLTSRNLSVNITATGIIIFFMLMMIISEFKEDK